ncbi:hypothetical protein N657DRAFT_352956 [Parathielavia appendiculata]|uniref:Uncharacterized protein n=1 Tax=Parathielavia appendiculata TaxID=2587402 RepID=A0AAN6U269_9PEZI|nr:hypothetical protein N657DRAFT_352956 [Parathielavia appendiculata]
MLELPMPAMTKLPSDSFWPKVVPDKDMGIPLPKLTSDSSSSLISPLTLPRGVAGYFDQVAAQGTIQGLPVVYPSFDCTALHKPRSSRVYSPLSPGVRGPTANNGSFLSPYLLPTTKQRQFHVDQHRSSSLPPQARKSITSPSAAEHKLGFSSQEFAVGAAGNGLSPGVNGGIPPMSLASASHPRSISADAISAPPHAQMIQRLIQQNSRMREAWEAERKYLEANRERAEEVYKEERALMEEERAEWEAEKAALLQEIERLRHVLAARGGTHSFPRTSLTDMGGRGGTRGASGASTNGSLSLHMSPQQPRKNGDPFSLNGHVPLPPMTSLGALELASPRSPNGPSVSSPDFLKSGEKATAETGPIPIVDVKEIHPELEGIPIKATSVKKATFKDHGSQNGSNSSSRSGSPPASSDQARSPRDKKEQTLQVLAADEAYRLTMHAGHTPSHSLSSLATVASSGTATATSNGGDSTPTIPHEDGASSRGIGMAGEEHSPSGSKHATELFPGVSDRHGNLLVDHQPEPILEPSEDRELKGPLMVRNMPAHDEIFFQKLSDKLEEVCKDDKAALPAVLQAESAVEDSGESCLKSESEEKLGPHRETAASDESGSAGSKGSKGSPNSGDEEDFDVPLKFKKRMNFGAPFGEIR